MMPVALHEANLNASKFKRNFLHPPGESPSKLDVPQLTLQNMKIDPPNVAKLSAKRLPSPKLDFMVGLVEADLERLAASQASAKSFGKAQ